jgi:uncharacterized protein (DUF58 family)
MPNRRNAIYALLIASLVLGLLTGRAFFFNLAYLFGGLLGFSLLWAWLSVQWIGVSRRTRSTRAQVGHVLEEYFTVTNRSILPRLWLEVRDHSTLANHRASHVVPLMGGRSSYSWKVQTPCQVRGEFQLGPMTFISGDPFGLFIYPRRVNATSRVVIYPMKAHVSHFPLPTGVLSGGDAQRQRTHVITTNATGVREYASGDSFNRIHWKTSARRDQLMVKEFELDPLVDIWLFLDLSSSTLVEEPSVRRINGTGPIIPTSSTLPPSTEEYAVVAAASLTQYFLTSERAVGFAAYAPGRTIHQPERGARQINRIFEMLAIARSLSNHTLTHLLTLETPYLGRGTTLILITASVDTRWVAAAQMLTSKGIRPVAIVVDPASFGGTQSAEPLRSMLRNARIPHTIIRKNDDIGAVLSAGTS